MNIIDRRTAETVGTVARRLGVSVRTLHHWDDVSVASPSGRTLAGYRAYLPADLARLRRVLLFRELGVPLECIRILLSMDAANRRTEWERHRRELDEKILRLQSLAHDVDRILAADVRGVLLSETEQKKAFGDGWDTEWATLARARWGDSTQWAEYAERSAHRTIEDWHEVSAAIQDVHDAFVQAKREGILPGSDRANLLAERHRAAVGEYFYCTLSMHALLARMYITEPGFTESYEMIESGLAGWMKQVIDSNVRANGIDPVTAVWQ